MVIRERTSVEIPRPRPPLQITTVEGEADRSREYLIADLFCGAGGTSTGALHAVAELGGRVNLVAVNHWPVAIETHQLNPRMRGTTSRTSIPRIPPSWFLKDTLTCFWQAPSAYTSHAPAGASR